MIAFLALTLPRPDDAAAKGKNGKLKGCPAGMSLILGKYCIDKYEASTVEMLPGGKTRAHSPYDAVDGIKVKAVSKKGVKPQAYISRNEAEAACQNAGKRLCTDDEWLTACKGKKPTQFPYGDDRKDGYCNDTGVSSFNHYYGAGAEPDKAAYSWANMNDPRLNQLPGGLALTGKFKKCKNGFDVYDMVGNLHEWTAAQSGTFRGGYYLDTHINGEGCDYRTTAHNAKYHDYSTGFRCCK
ncbi:Cell division protein FtsK [Minicystis rosea]|nr:Cell division protein FtsK [Minicystis rosea]